MLPAGDTKSVQPEAPPPAALGTPPAEADTAEPVTAVLPGDGVPPDLPAHLDAVERAALHAALGKTGGNRTAAAQLLGITFRQLRYRMQRLGLK